MGYLTTNWKSDLHRLAVGGAWFFALCSLFPLIWLGLDFNQGPDWVFGATLDGQTHTAWGLTYSGFAGALLKWTELLVVMAAIVATAAPRAWVPLKWSRIGHGVLIGWAGLWTAGLTHLAGVMPGFFALQALFVATLLGCTIYRAWLNWSDSNSGSTEEFGQPQQRTIDPFDLNPADEDRTSLHTDIASEEKLMIHLRDVKSSAAMTQVQITAPPTTWLERFKQSLRETFNRDSMRQAAHHARKFTVETARAAGSVSRAIGHRFVAAGKAWKSYDAEESSTRA